MKIPLLSSLKLVFLFFAFATFAAPKELPRFASIKSNEVNSRVGPGLQYPIAAIYLNPAEPIEIIEEFNNWRQIRDFDQDTSWVHVSLLSRKRSVIVSSALPTSLFKNPFENSDVIAQVFPQVRCEFLDYCNTKICKVKCSGQKGWIVRSSLWGIYGNEFKQDSAFTLYLKSIF